MRLLLLLLAARETFGDGHMHLPTTVLMPLLLLALVLLLLLLLLLLLMVVDNSRRRQAIGCGERLITTRYDSQTMTRAMSYPR